MSKSEQTENREHLDLTLSAGIIVETTFIGPWGSEGGLYVVKDLNGKYGIIAGGARQVNGQVETPIDTAKRELLEETGNPGSVFTNLEFIGNIFINSGTRMHAGFIYQCRDKGLLMGRPISDNKIKGLEIAGVDKVLKLLKNPDSLRKREFNFEVLLYWMQKRIIEKYWWKGLSNKLLARKELEEKGLALNPKISGIDLLF